MRSSIMIATAVAVLTAGPALAQGRGGGQGGGAGPPITPPGQMDRGAGAADAARDIGSQRGQFGRDFADQQRMTAEQRRDMAEELRATGQQRSAEARALAEALAQAERNGQEIPANAARRIREALRADMDEWRTAFQVNRREWQAMRDEWLVDRDSLTAQEWAQRRADWFAARDAWISGQRDWAANRSAERPSPD